MTRLYISGPVTGKPNGNYEAFRDAAYSLRAVRHDVIVPHHFVESEATHETAMLLCINELTDYKCKGDVSRPWYGGLALLPGWEQSEGAKLEKAVAEACGIPCKTVDEWLEEAL